MAMARAKRFAGVGSRADATASAADADDEPAGRVD